MELVARNKFFKIVHLTSSPNTYHHILEASAYTSQQHTDINLDIAEQRDFSYSARLMANIMFSSTFTGQLTGSYHSE